MTSFDISPTAVVGVLNEVNTVLKGYETKFSSFQTALGTLLTACKAEPIANEINGLSTSLLAPAMSNVAGRTGNAVTAVNNVVVILTDADQQMSHTARESAARAAQAAVDNPPPSPGGSGRGPGPQMY